MNRQSLVRRFAHQVFIYFQLKILFIRNAFNFKTQPENLQKADISIMYAKTCTIYENVIFLKVG